MDGGLHGFGISDFAELDEARILMQDVPDDFAEPVGDSPDRFDVSKPNYEAFENSLQMTPVGSGGGLSRLAPPAPHEAIAFGGSSGMVLAGALIGARADADPGSQLLCGRKGGGLGPDLGDDLLRRFRSDARDLNQPRDCLLIGLHLSRRQFVQLSDLPVDPLDPVQLLAQQPAVDVFHRAGPGIHQCSQPAFQFRSSSAASTCGPVSPLAMARSMRRPLTPSRSVMTEDNLMRPSSSRLSIRFCN
jgi:hypothetical protein